MLRTMDLRNTALNKPQSDREPHVHPCKPEEFDSRYTPGELLGEGGFGSVCAGVRKADGKQVAIKRVPKRRYDKFITIPGETHSLPLEVALMKMVSKPFRCENVLELLEWFEMSDCYFFILEWPRPCKDVYEFCKLHKGRLSEPLARHIMRQVVQAARHCCDCGVLHRDIKAQNLLINTDTLDVKLIDFGCGEFLKDTPYTRYAGTLAFCPPEWICEGKYLGRPATIWSLGVLLFDLVCGDLPFHTDKDIVVQNLRFAHGLSRGCCDLIWWCLARDPHARPTFEELISHKWFTGLQNKVKTPVNDDTPALQFPLVERRINPEETFTSRYCVGELLRNGRFGSVRAGVCKADGKEVAIKYMDKTRDNKFITIHGETHSLPLEVALMKMVSQPFSCENVLELIEWFEMFDCYVLILEQPSPCMDLRAFCKLHKGRLSEPLARHIMRQVVQAACHCCDCGVLHGDIKAENLLINTDTMEVKLKDFGCGDLLKDTPYKKNAGTRAFWPPEWIRHGEYLGRPATVWNLGVLLFDLVCGDLPFNTMEEITAGNLPLAPGLSGGCQHLITWCLEQDPHSRPTFEEILSHKWFTGLQK